jgi:hypothetical protein
MIGHNKRFKYPPKMLSLKRKKYKALACALVKNQQSPQNWIFFYCINLLLAEERITFLPC